MKGFVAALAAGAIASAASGAVSFQFAASDPPGLPASIIQNPAGGKLSNLVTNYDPMTSMFDWNVTFSDGVAKDTDGFWLVVSPGPNPKGHNYEFAIMYFDASVLANPTVSIYRYNGANAPDSFATPGDLLASSRQAGQTTIQNITASQNGTGRTFGFKVNAAAINSAFAPPPPEAIDWKGIQFGEKIGIWFHPVTGLSTSYGATSNKLKTFSFQGSGWYDGENTTTRMIPGPAGTALLALGGLVAIRRRR